jgi:hypothetical protein
MKCSLLALLTATTLLTGCACRERRPAPPMSGSCGESPPVAVVAGRAAAGSPSGSRFFAGPILDHGHLRGEARLRLESGGRFTWERRDVAYFQVRARGLVARTPSGALATELDPESLDRIRVAAVGPDAIEVERELRAGAPPLTTSLPLVFETGGLHEFVMVRSYRNDPTQAESSYAARGAQSVLAQAGVLALVETYYADSVFVLRRDADRAREVLRRRDAPPATSPGDRGDAR